MGFVRTGSKKCTAGTHGAGMLLSSSTVGCLSAPSSLLLSHSEALKKTKNTICDTGQVRGCTWKEGSFAETYTLFTKKTRLT